MPTAPLRLTRSQILAHRRRAGALDERLRPGASSLRRAAWAGLTDSMPRAALLSIHARVDGTRPTTWRDRALVQVWGPRFSAYVVPAKDRALFTVGRYPDDARGRAVAEDLASRLSALLGDGEMRYDDAGVALGEPPNRLRYASATGTLLLRWEGAGRPTIRMAPRPAISPADARDQLAERYVHVFGPVTSLAFARWAGISPRAASDAFERLGGALAPVRTPTGDAWILADDEGSFRASEARPAAVRLLPSGDPFLLVEDRELLVGDREQRADLWPSRVWPGGVLLDGDLVGTWRRAGRVLTVRAWRRLSPRERDAIERESSSLPLPGEDAVVVRWEA